MGGGILDISEFGATSCHIDPTTNLQDEIAEKLAAAYNCGFEFVYFDGSEGTAAPFEFHVANAQYRVLKRLQNPPIFCEAAAKTHFGWHYLGGGNGFDCFKTKVFKEKIDEFPVSAARKLQKDYTRVNFGWWKFWEGTHPDVYEYGMSRAAAWNCPTTVAVKFSRLDANPRTDEIFETLRRWEDFRLHYMTEEQKAMIRSSDKEYTPQIAEDGTYKLSGKTIKKASHIGRLFLIHYILWVVISPTVIFRRISKVATSALFAVPLGTKALPFLPCIRPVVRTNSTSLFAQAEMEAASE